MSPHNLFAEIRLLWRYFRNRPIEVKTHRSAGKNGQRVEMLGKPENLA